MFPKKSDWTLLYCWNSKQSMWELCDCIELTLILATGIKVDRTQYRHTHTKVELQRIHGIVSHLIFLYISVFFWRRKATEQWACRKVDWMPSNRKFVCCWSALYDYAYLFNRSNWSIFFSLVPTISSISFFLFIPVMFLEFALKYFQRKSMKGNPFSIGNQIEREWPFDQQIEQKQMKEERTNVHFIDSNSAGLFREWIEQCTQHKMCQKCLKETWSWFFHNFFVSFPRFGHHFDLIRFCCSFSKCYQIKTENISYFFPFLLLDYFRGRNRNVPFPLCALCSHS